MNLKQITPATAAVLVAALFVLVTGFYTDNGGFQLAGGLLLVVGLVLAFNRARDRDGSA